MKPTIQSLLDLVERIDATTTVAEAAETLLKGLQPLGALSLAAHDVSMAARLAGIKSETLASLTPAGYAGSAVSRFVDIHNPNPEAARVLKRPFRWREASLPTRALYGAFWEALGAFGAVDGVGVPVYTPERMTGVSLSFATSDWSPTERRAIEFACYAFVDKARLLSPLPPDPPKLSQREKDCLAFVAEGKTDWEISVILGVSQHTSHQHVENARRKLGATTRAQAVARFVMLGLL